MNFQLMIPSCCVNREISEKTNVISIIFSALQSNDLQRNERWDVYSLDN